MKPNEAIEWSHSIKKCSQIPTFARISHKNYMNARLLRLAKYAKNRMLEFLLKCTGLLEILPHILRVSVSLVAFSFFAFSFFF